MKNVASLKSTNTNSPKTPGGISKSLLTPCRRVGLSRNWKKKGPSPFVSPISSSTEVKEEKVETRKRKNIVGENVENTPEPNQDEAEENVMLATETDKTPPRNVELPRRKKSKTLMSALNKSQEDIVVTPVTTLENIKTEPAKLEFSESLKPEKIIGDLDNDTSENSKVVSTPVRSKSKKSKNRSPLSKSTPLKAKNTIKSTDNLIIESNPNNTELNIKQPEEHTYTIKETSPNELRKECIVVIQRKIFKNIDNAKNNKNNEKFSEKIEHKSNNIEKESEKVPLQALSDSDSDEVPLIQLNKDSKPKFNEDDDFMEKTTKVKEIKPKATKSFNTNKVKTTNIPKTKQEKVKPQPKHIMKSSQSSFDADDDDDFENKRTILIKKTYDKVVKPAKAKSTGSITQKDVDDLRAKIEAKKKLLLAKSITPETAELRSLIKKWQKGCQDALMELMDLMKNKFPEKQNMDYAEMLDTLKIPHSLVGYDSDNDCFNSPDDANIILGQL